MSGTDRWWRWNHATLLLALRVQPRASRDAVAGPAAGRLRVRLAAPPVDGAANDRLQRFLAEAFDVPRARVTLLAGAASRNKQVAVEAPARLPDWARAAGLEGPSTGAAATPDQPAARVKS